MKPLKELLVKRRRLVRLQECLINQLTETRLKLYEVEAEAANAAVLFCCSDYADS